MYWVKVNKLGPKPDEMEVLLLDIQYILADWIQDLAILVQPSWNSSFISSIDLSLVY